VSLQLSRVRSTQRLHSKRGEHSHLLALAKCQLCSLALPVNNITSAVRRYENLRCAAI